MSLTLNPLRFLRLSGMIATHLGLHYPESKHRDLERALEGVCEDLGFGDPERCLDFLLTRPWHGDLLDTLAGHLTVGETYFFRDKRCFDVFEQQLLPAIIERRRDSTRQIRIWSAGCCSGEEPYSIAIGVLNALGGEEGWTVSVTATDVNAQFLRKATRGLYNSWSFRGVPPWIRDRYFRATDRDLYEIAEPIKKMVTFSQRNLIRDAYPGALDVVFCRNVLMYFTREHIQRVVDRVARSLLDGGWLVVSPSEGAQPVFGEYTPVHFGGQTLFRKSPHGVPTATRRGRPSLSGRPAPAASPLRIAGGLGPDPWADLEGPSGELRGLDEPSFPGPPPPAGPGIPLRVLSPEVVSDEMLRDDPSAERASRLANEGKLEAALSYCDQALSRNRENVSLHHLRATILQELGRIEEAIGSLREALELDGRFLLGRFTLACLLYQRSGPSDETREQVDAALAQLRGLQAGDVITEVEGLTAGRIEEILRSMMHGGGADR